jgi:hypothetical protein
MTLKKAWQQWAKEVIYRGLPSRYTFPTAGSHYAAFKAGWDAASKEKK